MTFFLQSLKQRKELNNEKKETRTAEYFYRFEDFYKAAKGLLQAEVEARGQGSKEI